MSGLRSEHHPAPDLAPDLAQAKARVREAARALEESVTPAVWVRRHPWRAVGLALLAGYLLGQEPVARRLGLRLGRGGLLLAEGALLGTRPPQGAPVARQRRR